LQLPAIVTCRVRLTWDGKNNPAVSGISTRRVTGLALELVELYIALQVRENNIEQARRLIVRRKGDGTQPALTARRNEIAPASADVQEKMIELEFVSEDPDTTRLFPDVAEAPLARNLRDVHRIIEGADEDLIRICCPGARRGLDEHSQRERCERSSEKMSSSDAPLAHDSSTL